MVTTQNNKINNKMLINATLEDEIRVALVQGKWLYDLDIERLGREQKKSNIYKGLLSRVEPGLEAAFANYGAERHGFLPFREIAKEYWQQPSNNQSAAMPQDSSEATGGPAEQEAPPPAAAGLQLKEGQELILQIDKEERGSKGAALTTFISLAGSYLVLMPNNPHGGGISRRIEGEERKELRDVLNGLNIPEGMSVIVRTAGLGRNPEELQWDLDVLVTQWVSIKEASSQNPAPVLLHQESNVILRAIRDHLKPYTNEIVVDNPKIYAMIVEHMKMVRPDFVDKIKLYKNQTPLFHHYEVESQIESAFKREVSLPSGGVIVIDHTEALTSIDINSAKSTKGGDIEETALNTNLEAALEIARQLRLRDLAGLIVIDFIDMLNNKNQRLVENKLKEALSMDRAKIQVGRISKFGLLEMSRQRLKPALGEQSHSACPRCGGAGKIRQIESLALEILRHVEENISKTNVGKIQIELPLSTATYIINEKRQALLALEQEHQIPVLIIPNIHLETPNYILTRIKKDELSLKGYEIPSYTVASQSQKKLQASAQEEQHKLLQKPRIEKPLVSSILPNKPAPRPAKKQGPHLNTTMPNQQQGFIKRIWDSVFGHEGDQGPDSEGYFEGDVNGNTLDRETHLGKHLGSLAHDLQLPTMNPHRRPHHRQAPPRYQKNHRVQQTQQRRNPNQPLETAPVPSKVAVTPQQKKPLNNRRRRPPHHSKHQNSGVNPVTTTSDQIAKE